MPKQASKIQLPKGEIETNRVPIQSIGSDTSL